VLATGGDDWAINLWDATNGHLLRTLIGHQDEVTCLSWNNDGSGLASASRDGTVRVWRRSDVSEVHVLQAHQGEVTRVAWAPDGKRLASAGADSVVRVWDAGTGARLHDLKGHRGRVEALVFHKDGSLLASGGADGTVRLWDPTAGTDQGIPAVKGEISGLAFLEDQGLLAVSCHRLSVAHELVFCDLATRQEKSRWPSPGHLTDLVRSADGKRLAGVSTSGQVSLWDAALGRDRHSLIASSVFYKIAFRPDGRALATGTNTGQIKVWDLERARQEVLTAYQFQSIGRLGWLEDGRLLLTLGEDNRRPGVEHGGWDAAARAY
jgi:WD40 repeat protein